MLYVVRRPYSATSWSSGTRSFDTHVLARPSTEYDLFVGGRWPDHLSDAPMLAICC